MEMDLRTVDQVQRLASEQVFINPILETDTETKLSLVSKPRVICPKSQYFS